MTTIQIIGWLNAIAFVLVLVIISTKKKNRMAGRMNYQEILEHSSINENKYLSWLNPFKTTANTRFNARISLTTYWICTFLGMAASLAFVIFVLRFYVLIPATLVVGLSIPSIVVYYRKRKRRDEIYDLLSEYINGTSNLAITFGDPINALRELVAKDFVQEPIKSDVQKILLSVDNGLTLKQAFKNFENLYENNPYLEFFHENLAMQSELGGKMNDTLMDTAHDYDKALGLRIQGKNLKAAARSNFNKVRMMVGAVPLILMGFSYDYYLVFVESMIGKSVFTGIIIIGIYLSIQVERKLDQDTFFSTQ